MKILSLAVFALLGLPKISGAQLTGAACTVDSGRVLRQRLPALMDSAMIPGLALGIIDGGRLVYSGGFGVHTTFTR